MSRTIFERVLLFALPFIVYGVYLLLAQLRPPVPTRRHPWLLLVIAGLVLVALSFLVWRVESVEPTNGTYVAPHEVNGKIVPGYVVPPPERKS
jgi:hypothetical protein